MANEQIRKKALLGDAANRDVPKKVFNYFAQIIEGEVYLVERKVMAKIKLNNKPDFNLFD